MRKWFGICRTQSFQWIVIVVMFVCKIVVKQTMKTGRDDWSHFLTYVFLVELRSHRLFLKLFRIEVLKI